LGFAGFSFHHLRTHATLLLDHGVPVHIAAERIGDDPTALLRSYAKRKRKTTANSSVFGRYQRTNCWIPRKMTG
jgi:integrase